MKFLRDFRNVMFWIGCVFVSVGAAFAIEYAMTSGVLSGWVVMGGLVAAPFVAACVAQLVIWLRGRAQ